VKYNLSSILECNKLNAPEQSIECELFIDIQDEQIHTQYQRILRTFCSAFAKSELILLFQQMAAYKISLNIPYAIIDAHINTLRDFLLKNISSAANADDVVNLLNLFREIKDTIAHHYLLQYIEELVQRNRTRKNSLQRVLENDLIVYYQAHLEWLTNLAYCIKENTRQNFPELDHKVCSFGEWLHCDAHTTISNEMQYHYIYNTHQKLHLIAKRIYTMIETKKYRQLITYLEECELISLNLGVELSILDNTIISNKADTDNLTQALNRNVLNTIFKNQYELSIKTNNSFVLALCDLDHFKNINDTYGHLAGDAVLRSFVECIKKNTRNSDIVIRYGGEEFLIILPSLTKEEGLGILDNIRQKFEAHTVEFEGHTIHSTVSIGMIAIKPDKQCTQELKENYISLADKQLYCAKHEGRNRVIGS